MGSKVRIGSSAITRSALIGFFLHACYLGGVFYSISEGLPAGVAAVVTSIQPVLVSLLAVKVLRERLVFRQVVGLILGLAGVVLVLTPSVDSKIPVVALVAILVALMGSTTATLMQKKFGGDIPLVAGTAYQYLFSGIVLGVIALSTDQIAIEWNAKFTFYPKDLDGFSQHLH